MKVLAINGSPRSRGNTYLSLKVVTDTLEKLGVETEILQVGHLDIRGCIACNKCSDGQGCVLADDRFRAWCAKVQEADGLLIGSPVYYSGIAGTLKSFLDRVFYCSDGLRHKVASAVVALRRSGGVATFDQINHYFLLTEMLIAPSFYWNVIHGGAPGEAAKDTEGMTLLENLGQNMAWMLKMQEQTAKTLPPPSQVKREWMNFIR